MAGIGAQQHRHEGSRAKIDATPADVERALPFVARIDEEAATATDAGIVEQEMDAIGLVLLGELVTEAHHLGFVGHIGDMRGDALALIEPGCLAEPLGLGHRATRHVTQRDAAALGRELPRQLATHARAAAGDDGNPARKILHAIPRLFSLDGSVSAPGSPAG